MIDVGSFMTIGALLERNSVLNCFLNDTALLFGGNVDCNCRLGIYFVAYLIPLCRQPVLCLTIKVNSYLLVSRI